MRRDPKGLCNIPVLDMLREMILKFGIKIKNGIRITQASSRCVSSELGNRFCYLDCTPPLLFDGLCLLSKFLYKLHLSSLCVNCNPFLLSNFSTPFQDLLLSLKSLIQTNLHLSNVRLDGPDLTTHLIVACPLRLLSLVTIGLIVTVRVNLTNRNRRNFVALRVLRSPLLVVLAIGWTIQVLSGVTDTQIDHAR